MLNDSFRPFLTPRPQDYRTARSMAEAFGPRARLTVSRESAVRRLLNWLNWLLRPKK